MKPIHTARFEMKISPAIKKAVEKKALKLNISAADYIRRAIENDLKRKD